jgi:hypothetical protein
MAAAHAKTNAATAPDLKLLNTSVIIPPLDLTC